MNLVGYVIMFCEACTNQFHIPLNLLTYLIFTYIYIWKGKLFRTAKITEKICLQ